jgi:hypothetical protein
MRTTLKVRQIVVVKSHPSPGGARASLFIGRSSVTPYFSQKNKTLEIIYLSKEFCLLHSCRCIFSFVLMSDVLCYFAVRNHSKFKFGLNSNGLRILKGFEK